MLHFAIGNNNLAEADNLLCTQALEHLLKAEPVTYPRAVFATTMASRNRLFK